MYSQRQLRSDLELLVPAKVWSKVTEIGSNDFLEICHEVSNQIPEKSDEARFWRKNPDHP